MKILESKYPIGTIQGQKTAGRYIDGTLYENLKIAAKNITKDLTYLGICSSSTLEVGAGKTTLMSQIGEAYTDLVNQYHGTHLKFDIKNCVFRPNDLITRSFELPKYSFIFLDEWEETHYWSELAVTLRQFFRKCRQLNLFIMIIIPNFFQLGISYAVSRSLFFIDVRFEGEFDRGYFRFYGFEKKKELYLRGKKEQNYNVVKADFCGRFTNGYAFDEKEYRKIKYQDMIDSEDRIKEESAQKKEESLKLCCIILKKELKLSSIKISELFRSYGYVIDRHRIMKFLKENEENSVGEMGTI